MKQSQISTLLAVALDEANRQNVSIAVAVVDKGGHLSGFTRMEECSFAANEASRRKAASACAFKMPTDVIGDLVQKMPPLKDAFASFPDIFYFGGGLPILIDGKLIGAIGISGVDPSQDKMIAEKAVMSLMNG